MPNTLIIDTNVLLFDPQALKQYPNAEIIVPLAVIDEIDRFKHDQSETGRNARTAAQFIDSLRSKGPLKLGVELENGATFAILPDPPGTPSGSTASRLLAMAHFLEETRGCGNVRIVTKNISLRLQADAAGIRAEDFNQDTVYGVDKMKGWHVVNASGSQIELLRSGHPLPPSGNILWHPNEYAFIRDREDPHNSVCARFSGKDSQLWGIMPVSHPVCGIKPLNIEQSFAMDALLDDSIKLVTLAGKAGTGKTLLAIAAGLHQIFSDNRYQKLVVFRPTMPVSRDLGYLPGDLSEKMKPWMQPVFDALEFIRQQDRKSPGRSLPNDLLSAPEISVEPLTYIRGRSIPNQFIIIDETQNLTPLEVKTAVTRVGEGSKIILTGDPDQIDTPYVDAASNGLTRLIERFLPSDLSAHVTLLKGERSKLAETASTLL